MRVNIKRNIMNSNILNYWVKMPNWKSAEIDSVVDAGWRHPW